MKKFLTVSLYLITVVLGDPGGKYSILLEGIVGPFKPNIDFYEKVYTNPSVIGSAKIGVGYDNGYLIAGYRLFQDDGVSIVENLAVDGVAHWRQEMFSIGLRSIEDAFYFDIEYVIGSVKEEIGTKNPQIDALKKTINSIDNRGVSIAGGFLIPVFSTIHINLEAEYLRLPIYIDNSKSEKIQAGGMHFSAGLSFIL